MSGAEVNAYLHSLLATHAVATGLRSPVGQVMATLSPVIRAWGGQYIASINPSVSFSKIFHHGRRFIGGFGVSSGRFYSAQFMTLP